MRHLLLVPNLEQVASHQARHDSQISCIQTLPLQPAILPQYGLCRRFRGQRHISAARSVCGAGLRTSAVAKAKHRLSCSRASTSVLGAVPRGSGNQLGHSLSGTIVSLKLCQAERRITCLQHHQLPLQLRSTLIRKTAQAGASYNRDELRA